MDVTLVAARLTPAELAAKKAKQAEERDISPEYAQVDGAEIAYLARPDVKFSPQATSSYYM